MGRCGWSSRPLAERLGLSLTGRFHGDLTEHAVVAMLPHQAIFVLPSVVEQNGDTEGIPVALMEEWPWACRSSRRGSRASPSWFAMA